MTALRTRAETDSLKSFEVPAGAYWGIHSLRAQENFPISVRKAGDYRDIVVALAQVTRAASLPLAGVRSRQLLAKFAIGPETAAEGS